MEDLGLVKNWMVYSGCTKLTRGCDPCPSAKEAEEHFGESGHLFEHGYDLKMHPERFNDPINELEPQRYSVALGSDLFHKDAQVSDLQKIFRVMNDCPRHTFEIVTKRAKLAFLASGKVKWTNNIYYGITIESGEYNWRLNYLRGHPATYRFVQFLPLIGRIGKVDLSGVHLVGVVEESWGSKRPAKLEWINEIRDQCLAQGVRFSLNNNIVYKHGGVKCPVRPLR